MPTTAHASDPALMHTDAWLEGCPGNLLPGEEEKGLTVKGFSCPYPYSAQGTP